MEPGNFRRLARRTPLVLHFDNHSDSVQLFDLFEDPGEARDISREKAEAAAILREELETFQSTARPTHETFELSEEELEALKALGYF